MKILIVLAALVAVALANQKRYDGLVIILHRLFSLNWSVIKLSATKYMKSSPGMKLAIKLSWRCRWKATTTTSGRSPVVLTAPQTSWSRPPLRPSLSLLWMPSTSNTASQYTNVQEYFFLLILKHNIILFYENYFRLIDASMKDVATKRPRKGGRAPRYSVTWDAFYPYDDVNYFFRSITVCK